MTWRDRASISGVRMSFHICFSKLTQYPSDLQSGHVNGALTRPPAVTTLLSRRPFRRGAAAEPGTFRSGSVTTPTGASLHRAELTKTTQRDYIWTVSELHQTLRRN